MLYYIGKTEKIRNSLTLLFEILWNMIYFFVYRISTHYAAAVYDV